MADVECNQCGGKDFYNESGYYYCTECQTQTQEIQEHEFQEDIAKSNTLTKKVKKAKPKSSPIMTTWECWNVVIYNLTEELIKLGANPRLKRIIKCLWIRYLKKLQVINLRKNKIPKLQLVNSKRDACILYGIKKRKSRGSSTKSTSDESLNSNKVQSLSTIKRQRTKKKKALAEAQYEIFSQKSTQESSLHDETLLSLKSPSETSRTEPSNIKYNKYAKKILADISSKKHVKKHEEDIDRELKCHLTYRKTPLRYTSSPCVLSQGSVYYLLYLGLLINGDEIHLGDLFRFIREGNLTYNSYQHFFPDDMPKGGISLATTQHRNFDHRLFRMHSARLAKFLKITDYIKPPRISNLCKRYCEELNLPDSIYNCVEILLEKTKPKLEFTNVTPLIPNYEGRAITLIIFTMKLLFGLDDETEFEFSKYANQVNCILKERDDKMFDVIAWLKFLKYRQLILEEHHFPTQFANRNVIDSDLYLQYFQSKNIRLDRSKVPVHSDLKQVLDNLLEMQDEIYVPIEFPPSFKPFSTYSNILCNSKLTSSYPKYMMDLLKLDCSKMSVDFLLRPTKYLEIINKSNDVKILHGGVNDNIRVKNIENLAWGLHTQELKAKEMVNVKMNYCSDSEGLADEDSYIKEEPLDSIELIGEYNRIHENQFEDNERLIKKLSDFVDDLSTSSYDIDGNDAYNVHYNTFERHWMNFNMCVEAAKHELADKIYKQHPHLFRLFFSECCRIVEQTHKHLMEDYQMTEAYLVYVAAFDDLDEVYNRKGRRNSKLSSMIKQAIRQW